MLVDIAKPAIRNPQDFTTFYDQYASKLWGLILSADLPVSVSEAILAGALMKAWQHPNRKSIGKHQIFTLLLSLAYAEGLPTGTLKSIFGRS